MMENGDDISVDSDLMTSTTDICRDYLRNVCNRDKRCKFKHLTASDLELIVDTRRDPASSDIIYEFCHDFQNGTCDRHNCRFIHCGETVEAQYMESGHLPLRCKYEFELGVQDVSMFVMLANADAANAGSGLEPIKPICRDFIQRHCRRGKKCRFVHLDQSMNKQVHPKGGRQRMTACQSQSKSDSNSGKKRLRLLPSDPVTDEAVYAVTSESEVAKNITCLVATRPDASTMQYIKEENLMLRKEVADLRKQVSGLSATNEVLLEQNAQFRLQKHCMAEGNTATFSQAKTYGAQAPMSVSVPIAMSLSVPGQNQHLTSNPGLAGASLLTSDALTVTPVELVNTRPAQHTLNTVSVMPHSSIPAQIQISRSIPQNTTGIVSNIVTNDSCLLNDLHTLTSHQANAGPGRLHANIRPVFQQANIAGQSVTNYPITQNTTSSMSGTVLQNSHPSVIHRTCSMAGPTSITMNQAPQNIPSAGGLVVQQASRNITVETDTESLGRINRNIATAQMTHATLMTANQQNQSNAGPAAGNLSASIAAVAAQVIAAQGSLTQGNSEIGTAQISVPAVPCGSLASAIVPVTITTTLPVSAMVPTLSLDNSPTGLLATRMDAVGTTQHVGRVSMGSSCPATVVTVSLAQPRHHVVTTLSSRHVVGSQQQLGTPLNFRINQVPPVPPGQQQPGPLLHT